MLIKQPPSRCEQRRVDPDRGENHADEPQRQAVGLLNIWQVVWVTALPCSGQIMMENVEGMFAVGARLASHYIF